jgi:hypothetical protein
VVEALAALAQAGALLRAARGEGPLAAELQGVQLRALPPRA